MGYCTRYELECCNYETGHWVDSAWLEEYLCENCYASFEDERTWYSHVEDMKSVSLLHPDILMKLSGEGEESGDLWESYFLNGKTQLCKSIITYPPFSEDLLK